MLSIQNSLFFGLLVISGAAWSAGLASLGTSTPIKLPDTTPVVIKECTTVTAAYDSLLKPCLEQVGNAQGYTCRLRADIVQARLAFSSCIISARKHNVDAGRGLSLCGQAKTVARDFCKKYTGWGFMESNSSACARSLIYGVEEGQPEWWNRGTGSVGSIIVPFYPEETRVCFNSM